MSPLPRTHARARDATPWTRLRWSLVLLGGIVVYGTAGYILVQGWGFLDALYMTILTLTTVGYKEVHPLEGAGQVFTITVLVGGVSVLLITLSMVVRAIEEGGLGERGRRKRMVKEIKELRGHVIVCGYGRVGRAVCASLDESGAQAVVIDRAPGTETQLMDDGRTFLIGDATDDEVLAAAGIGRAKALICAVPSDADGIFIALTARDMAQDVHVIARASDKRTEKLLQRAGAQDVINPYSWGGREIARLVDRTRS